MKLKSALYVEDDLLSREIMQLIAESMEMGNIKILEDSSAFMAQLEAMSPPPDVILLDIHVRPLNGFAMLDAVRQHAQFRDTPVIALTASVMNEEINLLRSAGFNGVIAKPVDQERFPDLLQRIINGERIWGIV